MRLIREKWAAGLMAAFFVTATGVAAALAATEEVWDVAKARGETYEVDFETDEGTWMSVDTAPSGRWLAFDLLGHIYRLPAAGGEARLLTGDAGAALNFHPRISPDGSRIAFVSDRGGQNSLWVMDAEGGGARPLFADLGSRITSPAWLPDGSAIVAVREFPTYSIHRRSARIWIFPIDGSAPREIVGTPSGSGFQAYWPSPSPDDEHLYYMYASFAEPLHGLQRSQHIRRINLETGMASTVTRPFGQREYFPGTSADLAPEVSPDGRWISFARRLPGESIERGGHVFNARTALWVRDRRTGEERVLLDDITLDMQHGHGMKNLRVLPGYAWAKDSKSVVLWHLGKLWRVNLDGRKTEIPFTARIQRTVSEQTRWKYGVNEREVELKNLFWPAFSAAEDKIIFAAAGEIWAAPASGTRVSAAPLAAWSRERSYFMPAVSPDGRSVAFVSWNDFSGGAVMVCRIARCRPSARSKQKTRYLYPAWSGDGRTLYAIRAREPEELNYDLVAISPSGEEVVREGVQKAPISVGADGRIYALEAAVIVDRQRYLADGRIIPAMTFNLRSTGSGGDVRPEVQFRRAEHTSMAPDNKHVAFVRNNELYLTAIDWAASEKVPDQEYHYKGLTRPYVVPEELRHPSLKRISAAGAHSVRWVDARTLVYSQGKDVFFYDIETGDTRTITINASLPGDAPPLDAVIAIRNARVIALADENVLENADIVVEGARIACVGICAIPAGAHIIDADGKTAVPGFVDVHAHGSLIYWTASPEVIPQRLVPDSLYLSHGVTTRIDPAGSAASDFAFAEMIDAGRVVGARAYSVGDAIDIEDIRAVTHDMNYEEIGSIVDRLAARGAPSIKIFLTSRRDHRQMLVEHARKRGLSVTNEGADLYYNVGLILDGSTGWEHLLHYDTLYKDALEFFGRTKTVYSPTIQVAGAGIWAEEYWQARSNLINDPALRRFMPWRHLATRLGAPTRPKSSYAFPFHADILDKLRNHGGYTPLGGHGELWGLDSHWDIWSYAEAMAPLDVLKAATLDGARMLGLEDHIGSIEAGKLADIVLLAGDPLEDIRNTKTLTHVMKGGVLYDAKSLDRLWPTVVPYGEGPGEHPYVYGYRATSVDPHHGPH